jgi:MYXO-CTERM domain-containing protein
VFEDSGSGWVETKLTASDGAAGDRFGYSVAVSGGTVVVGARLDDDNGSRSGSAYLFEDSGSGWVETKLTASDGGASDEFGGSVAVSGDTVVVGARLDTDNGGDSGSVYVFQDSGSGWTETKLTASDGAAGDEFGRSVAVSQNTVLVGAPYDDSGSAYIFQDSGSGWVETKLTASDGTAGDQFGWSVAVSEDTVAVGAPRDNENGGRSGSAYLFEDGGTGWAQQAKLTASDGAVNDEFGFSVSVSGDTVAVGARFDVDGGVDSGSAYLFSLPNTAPTAMNYLRTDSTQVAANEDTASTITLSGTDADGESVTFEILTDPANGTLSITSADQPQSGMFDGVDTTTLEVTYSYSPTSETATTDIFTYRVADARGASDTGTVEIDITLVNEAPSITSTAPTTATEDIAYSYPATATDPEGDTLMFAVGAADTCGGTFTGGTYSFTPAGPTPPADCVVAIEVCDTSSECDSETATVAITAVNDAPSITSTAPTGATEDTVYTYGATAMDPEGDTLTFSVGTADTCGGSLTGSTYTFTPVGPALPADCIVAIEVCDTNGDCDNQSTTVTITPINDAPSTETEDGCGCASANAPSNAILGLLLLAFVRLGRRRRA